MLIKERTYANMFLLSGLIAHLLTALFSYGAHHSDELFQVFEFAGYKLGLNKAEELPWEFHNHMRSGLLPFLVFFITKAANMVSVHHPFLIATCIRLIVSLFSFYALLLMVRQFEDSFKELKFKNLLWFLSCLFWFLPYFHARLLSENVASTLFLFGFTFVLKNINETHKVLNWLIAGLFFGLSFICRFQMSFMIAGLIAWLVIIRGVQLKYVMSLLIGVFASLTFGLVLDFWLYHVWTLSWWNYLDQNVFHHAAANFGVQPLYYYLVESFNLLLPPLSAFLVFAFFYFCFVFRSHVITWIILPFIILHFFVGHKEIRFLFPLLIFLPVLLTMVIMDLEKNHKRWYHFISHKSVLVFVIGLNSLAMLSLMFVPADNVSLILKKMYELSNNQQVILLYDQNNPYNQNGSLNYFKNPKIKSIPIQNWKDTLSTSTPIFYFTEQLLVSENLRIKNRNYQKVYSKFPWWMVYFNFNQWLNRATFEIYKQKQLEP